MSSPEGYNYRRRLPHWRQSGAAYFVTWRLARDQPDLDCTERAVVASVIRHFDGARYELLAHVVMNDHVHLVVHPLADHQLERLVWSWKSYSAKILSRRRNIHLVWQDEYFDRIIRDRDELFEKILYIARNPTKRWPGFKGYPWLWIKPGVLG